MTITAPKVLFAILVDGIIFIVAGYLLATHLF
jgi:hypothetical protein